MLSGPPGLCLKVLVDLGHVLHHALPVRPVCVQHLTEFQAGFDAYTFGCFKCQQEIPFFLLTVQLLIWDMGRQVRMEESTEGQAITPAAAEIGDINVRIAFCLLLAPFQESIALGAAIFPGQGSQRVSPFHTEFTLWFQAPSGSTQQPSVPEAQRRGSAQRFQGGTLPKIRVWFQVLTPSL